MRRAATGVVLAGGASRRMGRDKALLDLGGRPLLQLAAEAVGKVCDEVVIAGRGRAPIALPGLAAAWAPDPPGVEGPLAGLAAGLAAAAREKVIAVACDMPFVNPDFLRRLLDELFDCDAVIPLAAGSPQPLHAAYSRDILPTLETLMRLGGRSMLDLLPRLRVKYLSERTCQALDPDGLSTLNVNTPAEYAAAVVQHGRTGSAAA